jgi:ABC-type branched-subunit amino acid transport system ATPase component
MTVLENIMVARHYRMKEGIVSSILRLPSFRKEELEIERIATEYATIFDLQDVLDAPRGQSSVWKAAASRDRARPGDRAEAPPARRTPRSE